MTNRSLTCTLKYATTSYKKINLMAKIVRWKNVVEILDQLKFIPKKTAYIFAKIVTSAAANATNNAWYDLKDLFVQSVDVGRWPKIKRFRMVAKWSWHGYIKHRAFVRVTLWVK
jgi:large subunit ribosomal protein L22